MPDQNKPPVAHGAANIENPDDWRCARVHIPADRITHISSIFEAHDNQFLVRTENRQEGIILIWYHKSSQSDLEEVVLDLQGEFPVRVISYSAGMDGLDEVYPE